MRFIGTPMPEAVKEVVQVLRDALNQHEHVLWLVSGGSCIFPQREIIDCLDDKEVSKLQVLLIDERFGPSGHTESNYYKLVQAGFVRAGLNFPDVLKKSLPFPEIIGSYAELLNNALASASLIIATMGIGADGHTAGILPRTEAARDIISSTVGYQGADFTRMTAGFSVLRQIDKAFVFAYGVSKQTPLATLRQDAADIYDVPSMVLYDIPEVNIYYDA